MTLPVIGALGAGRMGRGIAVAAAYAGLDVWLIDVKPRPADAAVKLRDEAFAEIRTCFETLAELGLFEARLIEVMMARVSFAARAQAAVALGSIDILFEGVPEVMDAKREAFAFAVPLLPPEAIVASTSSTFLSTTIAELVPNPARCLNAHFLNPAYVIPLVEVSPHAGTEAAVTARLVEVLRAMGKEPVLCAARPGYIVPRLQTVLMNEAARMIEEGVATAEDIDRATRYGLGVRYAGMGVVEFIDYGGNDILYYASAYLSKALDSSRHEAPEIVNRYMREGKLGLKSGTGFYDWKDIDVVAYRHEALARLVGLLRYHKLIQQPGCAQAALGGDA